MTSTASNNFNSFNHSNSIQQPHKMERLLNNNSSSSSNNTHKAPKDVVSSNSKNKNPSSWEPIDDILLRHLKEIKKMGWKEISQYFTNRTPNACQFRWRRLKSGNLKSNKTALMDVTIFPGEIKILNPSNIDKKSSKDNHHNNANTKLASSSTSQPHSEKKNETIKLPVINNTSQQLMPPPPSTTTTSTTTTVQLAPLKFTQNKVTFNSNRRNSSISNNIIHNNTSTNHSPTGQSTFSPRGSFSINHPSMDIDSQTNDILIENETVKDFVKPRSYSHTLTSHAMTPVNSINGNLEVENVGFIPKVFVKSRRSSFIVPPTSPMSLTQSINNALNTTLTTSKSRKNSFVHYQRRYSLAAVSSTSSSRRSSIIVAPNSMSTTFNNYQLPTSKQRRESIIRTHKNGTGNNNIKHSSVPTTNLDVPTNNANTHLFNHNYSFTDMPTSTSNKAATSAATTTTTTATTRNDSTHWSVQEDKLLLENKYRNLSLPELSILLPNKSESDIDLRLTSLRANNNVTSQANENAVESSSSSNSPTPQLQLPEYVSPIHSPTRSLILNQSDSIINSQEYKDHLELGTKRSGTAESQASSSSKGGISPSEFSQTSPDNDTASSISSVSMNAGHNNNNNMKSQDYSTLLRSARQTSNDHSSLPHHHDSIEQTNTHQMHHHQMHHQAPQQQMPHQTPYQTHQQLPQQLPSINTIFQGI